MKLASQRAPMTCVNGSGAVAPGATYGWTCCSVDRCTPRSTQLICADAAAGSSAAADSRPRALRFIGTSSVAAVPLVFALVVARLLPARIVRVVDHRLHVVQRIDHPAQLRPLGFRETHRGRRLAPV